MSRAQLSAFIQASGSDQSMRSGRSRSSSRCQNKVPIIVIASPHPTVLTSNIEPDNPVEMSAEMMTSAASPMQASVMASIAGQMSGSTPVRQTSSGSLIMTANIKVTQSGSQGRSTPSGLRPRRGSSDMLQVVGAGSIESMGCSGIFGVQMAGTDLFQELHEQGMQQHAMRAGRRGSRRGSRRSISRGSACASATSLSALAEGRATQRGAGQMNLVVNIPTPQDPTGKSLTVTIVQDAGSATIQPEPAPTMTMSSTAIMRQM
ncbi:uncharacterized protein LOC144094607 isoform X2 [Amblyomma americanum]